MYVINIQHFTQALYNNNVNQEINIVVVFAGASENVHKRNICTFLSFDFDLKLMSVVDNVVARSFPESKHRNTLGCRCSGWGMWLQQQKPKCASFNDISLFLIHTMLKSALHLIVSSARDIPSLKSIR